MSPVRFQTTKFLSPKGCCWDLLPSSIDWGLPENGWPHFSVICSRSNLSYIFANNLLMDGMKRGITRWYFTNKKDFIKLTHMF